MRMRELAVIEGSWNEDSNLSISSVFNTLSDLLYGTPHGYQHYHFSTPESLVRVIHHVAQDETARMLYLGAHGDESRLHGGIGGGESIVSRTKLRNALWRCWNGNVGQIDGIYLGACSFVSRHNAEYLLCGNNAPRSLKWVAGFSKDISWIDSIILDMLFLRNFLSDSDSAVVRRVKQAAGATAWDAPGLVSRLGFNVWVRSQRGGVKPIIELPDVEDADAED